MSAEIKYKVCTKCFTYNQEPYILDALGGFVMQETTFPVVYVIVDDASTDNTSHIIRDFFDNSFSVEDSDVSYQEEASYGTVLFAQHKTKRNCFFAVLFLNENHYSQKKSKAPYLNRWADSSEYIALCEGDDYWTDPLKLQKQVDFLDAHNDYILCCHRYQVYCQHEDKWEADYVKELFESNPDGFSFTNADNLRTWITKTVTLMYRRECHKDSDISNYKYWCDEHRYYHLLKLGPGYCFPFVGAVYRRCDTGVFSPLSVEQKERRYLLIRSELLSHNMFDFDLRDTLWNKVKQQLYSHSCYKETFYAFKTCIRCFYLTDGFGTSLRLLAKGLVLFVKGF